ncbi:MAG TPA: hypothetical protein VGE93_20305 [Bryobacteraceae bacterium]
MNPLRDAAAPSRWRGNWPQVYFGVAATSLASLLLELSLTRVFSVIYYYHFAFLAISIALFGLGAGGVFSYVVAGWGKISLYFKLGILAASNAVAIVLCLWFLLARTGQMTTSELLAAYFVAAIPFLFSGTIISLAVAETIERVNRVYFFDLIGAAGGCAVLVPLLNLLGGPNTILVAAVLFAVSAAVWFHLAGTGRGRALSVLLGLALVALITYNYRFFLIDVKFAKGQQIKNEEFVRWNSFSRIALKQQADGARVIVIDADANTYLANLDFNHLTDAQRFDLAYRGPGLPYLLRPAAKTVIIGPGGGWDVARALASGSKDITGVEINPIIANVIMRKKFPQYTNGLYLRPEIKIEVEDGRAFIRRSQERYQVLQATLVDTWASTAAGAFALSENNLYTTNAFVDYLSHLTDDGLMAFTRWGFKPPRESLRVVSLADAALKQLGEANPAQNVIVVRENGENLNGWGAQDTILIARHPFSPADIERVKNAAAIAKMQAVYVPGTAAPSAFRDMLLSRDLNGFYDSYDFDVRPVSDNRPFFFYTVQARDLWNFITQASRQSADYKLNSAIPLLFGLVGISIIATLVILSLPPLVLGHRLPASPGHLQALLFFVCIGVGYILVQVSLIQKFVLFLGHPTYALTVIIFSMLLSSGLGSFASKRLIRGDLARLSGVMLLIVGAIILLSFIITPVSESGVALPFALKVLISVALISPVGFAMGMPFPTGLALLEKIMPASVRWAWAINAASSVMGSAAAMFLAIYVGLQMTLVIGGLCYLAAWISALRSPLNQSREAEQLVSAI